MKKARALLAAAAAIAGLVAFASPAQADPPNAVLGTSFPDPLPGTETDGENGFCPFPVHVDYLSNQLVRKSTTNSDGSTSTRITGWATAAVTNLTTGKTLKFKTSGPGLVTVFPDGAFNLDLGGANLLWTTLGNSFVTDPATGATVPQLAYSTGHVQVKVDEFGDTYSYELNGNGGAPTDVCALLA
jgi:hypothetical protein